MSRTVITFFVLLVSGCGTTTVLTDAGKMVKLMKSDPSEHCEEIGDVDSDTYPAHSDKGSSKNMLRNRAAEQGSNYVRLETYNSLTGTFQGTAYKCP